MTRAAGILRVGNGAVYVDARARVTPDSLERIRRCAASDPRIGIVSPVVHAVPNAERAVERAAVPVYPEVAAPDPACLFVRDDLAHAIGAWDGDAARYAARAREAGYRNVLCDDACATFPDAAAGTVPVPIRAMIEDQLAMVTQEGKPGVLHVAHARGGGTEKYIRELIAASSARYRHYFLRIHGDHWLVKPAGDDAVPGYAWPRAGADPHWLRAICAWLRIGAVHVHSLVGSGDDLADALARAGVPYCYSAHDMYLPCPTVYLIDREGSYCDATTDAAACRACLAGFPEHAGIDIVAWRERHRRFLAGAGRVYAPSRWAAATLGKYFPGIAVQVAPPHAVPAHPLGPRETLNAFPLPDDGLRNVGMLGAIGPEKGARIVEAMAARIRARGLPLRIVVVGYTDRQSREQSADMVLTVHGPYRRDEIEPLLDAYRIGLVVFPTIWPETFSYTLSEAWSAGRPVLVPPRGALDERIEATGAGWRIDAWPEVDALLDQLVALTAPENAPALAEKSRLARAADDGADDDERAADTLYRGLLAQAAPAAEEPGMRYGVYEAACRAAGVAPLPLPLAAPRESGALVRLLRG